MILPSDMIAVLCLDEELQDIPPAGGIEDPSIFDWGMSFYRVPGATVQRTLAADRTLIPALIESGRQAQNDGAKAVITNCGYMVAFSDELCDALSIPVAVSSLLLLPLLNGLRPSSGKIGILTFDAERLTSSHLEQAWPTFDPTAVVKYGMEATSSWARVYEDGRYDWAELQSDSLRVIAQMQADHPELSSIIIECCALCSFMPAYRTFTRVPVYDIVSLSSMITGAQDFRNHKEVVAAGVVLLDHVPTY